MSDLFRGYDLTTVVEKVAERRWSAMLAASDLTDEGKTQRTWDKLPATAKRNFKEELLPVVTDLLEVLEVPDDMILRAAKDMWEMDEALDPRLHHYNDEDRARLRAQLNDRGQ